MRRLLGVVPFGVPRATTSFLHCYDMLEYLDSLIDTVIFETSSCEVVLCRQSRTIIFCYRLLSYRYCVLEYVDSMIDLSSSDTGTYEGLLCL
ncbi:hypothetical protein CONLIGDRAFT_637460 [Coniochaeta ligniaria NRRL 30616]|uniref:Uncharacterized protein n=1 Tax=Coniochaeta ligniaria NRRL 30616 TaxID=1408157 RepID=A0A1J7I7N0_9PEZI|nr:hypothetical protein CONLIGDRAFT_637460 [Coniochaeta ligniaria NRRL 30616]